jgi:flagellar biosynthesis/type III secretory pathway protein FliH
MRVQAIEQRLREAHDAAVARLEEERAELKRLAAAMERAIEAHARDSEELAVEVGYAATLRLLGEAAADRSLMPGLCRAIVREHGHPSARLRVSDLDLPLLASVDLGVPVEGDRRLAPGQCVIDTARGQFESGLDVRLAALAAALGSTLAAHRGEA